MDYKSDYFQNLQYRLYDVFNDVDPLHGPIFEDDDDYDKYYAAFKSYEPWILENKLKDSVQNRIAYLQFIMRIIWDLNSPDFFAYHLTERHFNRLQNVIVYFANEVMKKEIDPENRFRDFMISASADYDEPLRDLRYNSEDELVEKYFNFRWDLFLCFAGGIYSIYDQIISTTPEM